jgi:hypothetical protein
MKVAWGVLEVFFRYCHLAENSSHQTELKSSSYLVEFNSRLAKIYWNQAVIYCNLQSSLPLWLWLSLSQKKNSKNPIKI